jgi:hypothetical protein
LHAIESFPSLDGAKARRELGHEPRPVAETLTDLHAYFVEIGRLRAVTALQ